MPIMPQILTRQPRWLDHGSAGYNFFRTQEPSTATRHQDSPAPGPLKKVAHRGTEVFVAVGNELRWSDLAALKGSHQTNGRGRQSETSQSKRPSGDADRTYKVLKTPVARPIRQLSVSPSGDFIAILTSHTCHVCILPPHEHLNFQDPSPVKLRYFQVGPTAHVLEQSPIVSALWHPLSASGNDLVTISQDACVRLFELNTDNRSTFDEPALAVDLKKLVNATSVREDFSASKFGVNKGFSPDEVEMQVAAGCFGGQGNDIEDGWSSMTLWIAMTEGDVYALCPLLPKHFRLSASSVPSLSTSVVAKWRAISGDADASEADKRVSDQQHRWLGDLDAQDPVVLEDRYGNVEIYKRPERLGAIPRLQGPFTLVPEPDFGEVTDIHVVAPKLNDDDLFDDVDDGDFKSEDGLSVGVVCLATDNNKVHICLNFQGVEADWLPHRRSRAYGLDDADDEKELLLFETLDFGRSDLEAAANEWWPSFTASPGDRYELYTTQPTGVYSLSLRSWINPLEDELAATQNGVEGIEFRLDRVVESSETAIGLVTPDAQRLIPGLNAAIAIYDSESTEYVVLTCASSTPFAALIESRSQINPFAPDGDHITSTGILPAREIRAPYQPSEIFFQRSALPQQIEAWRRESVPGSAEDITGQLRFSPFNLLKLNQAHRILSTECHTLGLAAGEVFRLCERMTTELEALIVRVRDISHRIDSVTGEDEFPGPAQTTANTAQQLPQLVRGGRAKIQSRMNACHERNAEIQARVERLQLKTVRTLGGKPLSASERIFADEVRSLERALTPSSPSSSMALLRMEGSHLTASSVSDSLTEDGYNTNSNNSAANSLVSRFAAAQDVFTSLSAQAETLSQELERSRTSTPGPRGAIPTPASGFRKQKLAQVRALLDRETALVDAVAARLGRLQTGARCG